MPHRVIKRYSNRKLYDTVARRFTTLDAMTRQVESGVRVVVQDHDTGADLTDDVLAPVLARLVARRPGGVDLLTNLLRTSSASSVSEQGGPTDTTHEDTTHETTGREDIARQEEEIRELRDQVSQLTDAVTLLLRERNDELSA